MKKIERFANPFIFLMMHLFPHFFLSLSTIFARLVWNQDTLISDLLGKEKKAKSQEVYFLFKSS